MRPISLLILVTCSLSASAQSIVGKWKTIDDETGKARSVVQIFERDGKYFGRVEEVFPEEGESPDPVCHQCEDHRKGQKILGMEIITDMRFSKKENAYIKGEILDPENGNIYDCKMWLEADKLNVRGYLLFFYKTQTWLPYTGD